VTEFHIRLLLRSDPEMVQVINDAKRIIEDSNLWPPEFFPKEQTRKVITSLVSAINCVIIVWDKETPC